MPFHLLSHQSLRHASHSNVSTVPFPLGRTHKCVRILCPRTHHSRRSVMEPFVVHAQAKIETAKQDSVRALGSCHQVWQPHLLPMIWTDMQQSGLQRASTNHHSAAPSLARQMSSSCPTSQRTLAPLSLGALVPDVELSVYHCWLH
jgi:hypothetical protein